MRNSKNKIIIIVLMLVTLVGQALASTAVSCSHEMNMEMPMMDHGDMPDNMNHSSMMMSNGQDQSQRYLMDCCQEQCKCPMSSCISISLLLDTNFNVGVSAEQKIPQLSLIHRSQINASLYRPPIS